MIKIRIAEFYTELCDSEQSATIHTDTKEVPHMTPCEMAAPLRDMTNGAAPGNNHNINIKKLKSGENTISKTLAKLYTRYLTERRIPTAWKEAKMVKIFNKGNK